ncbi:MAG: hypothetical protein ACRET2_16700 [Steroidobacteraceae bacterium]
MTRYATILTAWQFTPEITLGLVLLAWLYAAGMRRRARAAHGSGRWNWRPCCFFAGVATLYIALQSPLDFRRTICSASTKSSISSS